MNHHIDNVKAAADAAGIMVVVLTIAKWLPPLAALFSIVWTVIRIYETQTCKRFVAWVFRRGK